MGAATARKPDSNCALLIQAVVVRACWRVPGALSSGWCLGALDSLTSLASLRRCRKPCGGRGARRAGVRADRPPRRRRASAPRVPAAGPRLPAPGKGGAPRARGRGGDVGVRKSAYEPSRRSGAAAPSIALAGDAVARKPCRSSARPASLRPQRSRHPARLGWGYRRGPGGADRKSGRSGRCGPGPPARTVVPPFPLSFPSASPSGPSRSHC